MSKGFTFNQIAAIILVIIGLVALIIFVSTQLINVGDAAGVAINLANDSAGALAGFACEKVGGGKCSDGPTCPTGKEFVNSLKKELDCPGKVNTQGTKVAGVCCEK